MMSPLWALLSVRNLRDIYETRFWSLILNTLDHNNTMGQVRRFSLEYLFPLFPPC